MSYEYILVAKEPPIATVTLNRPQQLNALSSALIKELAEAMESLDLDPEVRAIVLTGGGKGFCRRRRHQRDGRSDPFRRPSQDPDDL